jgi:short-subunit dehydrogenase
LESFEFIPFDRCEVNDKNNDSMNKLIVVTGGSKGIGKSIISTFASNGFDVVTCARSSDDLVVLANWFERKFESCSLTTCVADLSLKEGTAKFVEIIAGLGRPVEVLVNNAGSFLPGSILAEEEGVFDQMIAANLSSAYHVSRGILPSMISQGRGHLFMMCSTASFVPYVNGGSYCIAKYGLLGMTRVLREELKPQGIKVTAIMPGATYTDSWKDSDLPEERLMDPDDVAAAVYSGYSLSSRSVMEEIILRPQLGDL